MTEFFKTIPLIGNWDFADPNAVIAIVTTVSLLVIPIIKFILKYVEKLTGILVRISGKEREIGVLNAFERVLCRIVDYTAQCEAVDRYFFHDERKDEESKDRGVFFIEGRDRDWLDVLPDHLAVRNKLNNYEGLDCRSNVDNLLARNVKRLNGVLRSQDDFERQLCSQMVRSGGCAAMCKEVARWVNNRGDQRGNGRKVIYAPLDDRIGDKALVGILASARSLVDGLSIAAGRTLIVLFCFESTASRLLGIAAWRRNRRRKKLAGQGIELLARPTRVDKRDLTDWIRRLEGLCRGLDPHTLKVACNGRFPARKRWYYEELQGPLIEVLIAARIK